MDKKVANRLGWFGNILFILGAIFIAHSNASVWIGLFCNVFANIIYIIVGIMGGLSSLSILSFVLGVINAYGLFMRITGKVGL